MFAGLVLIAAAALLFWVVKPREGKVSRWVTMPVLQSMIPITITSSAALGLAMIVAGALR
jgi:hypothetical protein